MAAEPAPATRTWIARAFTAVEDIIYLGLAVLLAGTAGVLLVGAFREAVGSLWDGTQDADIVGRLDRLLLILLVVELLYTVQVSFRERTLVPGPFLLVGLIAVIRRVLVVTAALGHPGTTGGTAIEPLLWELGVLSALILAIAVAFALLRKRGEAPVGERA
ncbi:MAG: hypothetical protein JWO38_4673 [Gemmataceae bacterium]|nr:hypothetical protein [Gemmataceae bacterium]